LAGLAKALADGRDGTATPVLAHTEVVVLAAAAEEAGLRGAKRYVAAHLAELKALPTYGLFVDGVYDERHLTVVHREVSTGTRHDPRLVALAKDIAKRNGWSIRGGVVPFGSTDASTFSLAGVPAVLLLCQDIVHLVPNYHTRLDTIDRVRPQSLVVTLQMLLDMIQHIDEHGV